MFVCQEAVSDVVSGGSQNDLIKEIQYSMGSNNDYGKSNHEDYQACHYLICLVQAGPLSCAREDLNLYSISTTQS